MSLKNSRYPEKWLSGPDPDIHARYHVWQQQRNQAQFRGEPWAMPFDTWCQIWDPYWPLRGRCRGHYCMSRLDWDLGWTPDNVQIITREEHSHRQSLLRGSRLRSQYRQRKLGLA
jgi:hypothetical protein